MKKKLIMTALLFGTFTFANAQSIGDITKATNTVAKTATAASAFDVASYPIRLWGCYLLN